MLQFCSRHSEEQFVVVASMEGHVQWVSAVASPVLGHSHCGNLRRFDARTYSARGTQSREIGGKAVRDIHHRGGQAFFGQPATQCEARFRVEMLS